MSGFVLRLDASGVRQGAQEATSALRSVENAAQNTSQAIGNAQTQMRGFSGIDSSGLQATSQRIVDVSESLNAARISANGASSGVSSFIGAAKGVAAIGAFAVVAKQVYDVTAALNAAGSQSQETANKFNVVFASVNATATATAKQLAAHYGMAYESAQASLSSVGDLLTGLGVSQGEALKLAKQATVLGTDLASFTNYAGGATGAVQALTSAMLGETDAAKGLGLVLQDDQMKKYAASVGKVWDKLEIAEKAQLRLNAAISQSPNAVGDFARSMGSYANQMRVASAMAQDFQNTIGEGLVPVSAQLVSALNVNRESIDVLGQTIGGFINSELNSIVGSYDVLSGKSSGLAGDTLGLATSFVGLAGGAKAAFNTIQLVGNGVIYSAKAIAVGTKQIALSVDSLLALGTFDFDRINRNSAEFKRLGVEYANDLVTDFKEDFLDLQKGMEMLQDPEGYAGKYLALLKKLREESAKGAIGSVVTGGNKPAGSGKPAGLDPKAASAAASALKSVTSELAKLQLTDAQYQQWQVAQKIDDLEKALGKANPKVKELAAELRKDLDAKFLASIQEYADPAAAQIEKINKAYKELKTNLTDPRLTEAQKDLYSTQAAKQYEIALEGVAGTTQSIAKITREQEKTEAELSGNRTRWWEIRREELNDLYGLESSVADKAQVSAAVERQLQIERMQKEGDNAFSFAKLWEETYKRVDEAGADMIEGFLTGSKNGLDSLKNMAIRTVAEMANAMVLRPITVQVMGVMGGAIGGVVGGSGMANAAGGGGGFGMPNIPVSSFMPESWTSGISGFMGTTLPGSAYTSLSQIGMTSGSLSTSALQNAGALAAPGAYSGGLVGGLSLGSALAYGGMGGLGYGLLGGALGLPQNKYSSLTATAGGALGSWGGSALGAALGSSGAISGAMAGSMAFPVVGTILGALGGGLLSSVFGGKKPKRPAVWGGAEIDLGSDNLYAPGSYDFGATFDPKGYGRDAFEMYEDGNYAIATRSRNKASSDAAKAMSAVMREVAELGVQQADAVQDALPESYAAAFKAQLSANPVSAEWDFKGDEISEESFKQAAEELQAKLNESMLSAFQGMDFSEYAGKINVDQSAFEGLTRFTEAIKLTEETISATAEISNPLSEMEQQANAAKAQLTEWTKAMETAGVTTEYAGQLMTDYSEAMIGKFIGDMEQSLNPLSQYAQAQKDANDAVDDRLAALKILGATEAQLAQVEGLRSSVLEAALGPMSLVFEQDMRIREAQLSGNDSLVSSTQLAVQHEKELAEVRDRFGADSAEYARVQSIQIRETEKLRLESDKLLAESARETARTIADAARTLAQSMADTAADVLKTAQSLQIRGLNASGATDEAAILQMQYQHQQELEDARKQQISLADQQVLQAKAAALNKGESLAPGQDTGGWTAEKVQEEISKMGLTVREWLETYGAKEGFAGLGAGYTDTAYIDELKVVQSLEMANLLASQAKNIAANADRELQEAKNDVKQAQSEYDAITSKIEGLVRQLGSVADKFKAAADSLQKARQKLWEGDSNLNVESRLSVAQGEFDRLAALAMAGDSEAAAELPGMADSLLALYRETARSSEEYMDAFHMVDQKMRLPKEAQERLYQNAKSQYDMLVKQYGLQETQSLTQQQILEKLTEYQKEQFTINQSILAAKEAERKAAEAAAAAADAARKAAEAAAAEAAKPKPTPTPPVPSPTPPTSPSVPNPPKPATSLLKKSFFLHFSASNYMILLRSKLEEMTFSTGCYAYRPV